MLVWMHAGAQGYSCFGKVEAETLARRRVKILLLCLAETQVGKTFGGFEEGLEGHARLR